MADSEKLFSREIFISDRENGLRPGVVVCVINRDARVLLCFKKEYLIWEFPQGGIEENEELKDAIAREINEELGQKFFESLFIPENPLVAVDQIVFPKESIKGKTLAANGKEIPMTGKKYYFCAVAQVSDAEPSAKEYFDFKWVSFAEGSKLIETISQKGKKRVLKKALEILKEGELIK